MGDTHLVNLSRYLKDRIAKKAYLAKHECTLYRDCLDCAVAPEVLKYWEGWMTLITLEQRRRRADASRRKNSNG